MATKNDNSSANNPFSSLGGISSPYLNFDPSLISGSGGSDYIFPDGASNRHSRGRFELAFGQIGGSVMTGAALGGFIGGINGFKQTLPSLYGEASATAGANVQKLSWSVRRSQILNYITKTGANTANAFGIVALVYSAIGVGLGLIDDTKDDFNTITAATATGILYRGLTSPKIKKDDLTSTVARTITLQLRLRRAAIGGLIGFAAASAFVVLTDKEKYFKK